jgi:hypothetical protein
MLSIEQRMDSQEFWAFSCYDTIEKAYERVKMLVDTGRPMVRIFRYLDHGDPEVTPGVRIWTEGIQPGVHFQKYEDWATFSLTLDSTGMVFGLSGFINDGTEREQRDRFHAAANRNREPGSIFDRRHVSRIKVQGFGKGRDDHAIIRSYNEHGVGSETALYFQYDSYEVRAEREAAFLDVLAERDWTANDIRKLAEKMRKWREPLAENLNFYMEEMNR